MAESDGAGDPRPGSPPDAVAPETRIVAVIPARYASSRFPGKPLVDLLGKPMIRWVYERAAAAPGIRRVLVATDDDRIADAVRAFGGEVRMTSADHPTGTDRLAEVAADLDADLIVNVQGDEPTLHPDCISQALGPILADPSLSMGTLRTEISEDEVADPNVVKVVVDRRDRALYFSRAPIPYRRAGGVTAPAYKHIGLYVYRRPFLLAFARLPPTPLERCEALEQLRALEHGHAISAPLTDWNPLSIDTPADVDAVLRRLRAG